MSISTTRSDRFLFTSLIAGAILVAFVGFAPTYFLGAWFASPPLDTMVHIHAALFSAWLAILLIQSILIRTHRPGWHARFGILALSVVALMVITGFMVVLGKPRPTPASQSFIFTPLLSLVMFPLFVACAIRRRRDPATHKRLMWLGTLLLMGAPMLRLLNMLDLPSGGHLRYFAGYAVLLVPLILYDLVKYRRLHAATAWGTAALLLRHPLHEWIAFTPEWRRLAVLITAAE
jgi:predicted small integral membrane protein